MTNLIETIKQGSVRRNLFWALLTVLVTFFVLYLVFLSTSILNVVMRGQLEKDIAAISSDLGGREAQYLAAKNKIDINTAEDYGFVEVKVKQYATRNTHVGALSQNSEI